MKKQQVYLFSTFFIGIVGNMSIVNPALADWAAIAYSRKTGAVGVVAEVSTPEEAAKSALNVCGKADCELVLADDKACIAVAAGGDGVIAGGGDPLWARDAATKAKESCDRRSSRLCSVVASICSNGSSSR